MLNCFSIIVFCSHVQDKICVGFTHIRDKPLKDLYHKQAVASVSKKLKKVCLKLPFNVLPWDRPSWRLEWKVRNNNKLLRFVRVA